MKYDLILWGASIVLIIAAYFVAKGAS